MLRETVAYVDSSVMCVIVRVGVKDIAITTVVSATVVRTSATGAIVVTDLLSYSCYHCYCRYRYHKNFFSVLFPSESHLNIKDFTVPKPQQLSRV